MAMRLIQRTKGGQINIAVPTYIATHHDLKAGTLYKCTAMPDGFRYLPGKPAISELKQRRNGRFYITVPHQIPSKIGAVVNLTYFYCALSSQMLEFHIGDDCDDPTWR